MTDEEMEEINTRIKNHIVRMANSEENGGQAAALSKLHPYKIRLLWDGYQVMLNGRLVLTRWDDGRGTAQFTGTPALLDHLRRVQVLDDLAAVADAPASSPDGLADV